MNRISAWRETVTKTMISLIPPPPHPGQGRNEPGPPAPAPSPSEAVAFTLCPRFSTWVRKVPTHFRSSPELESKLITTPAGGLKRRIRGSGRIRRSASWPVINPRPAGWEQRTSLPPLAPLAPTFHCSCRAVISCGLCCSMYTLALLPLLLSVAEVAAQCSLTRHMLYVEKEGCDFCMAINTTICAGFCMSQDVNIKAFVPKMVLTQRVCTYRDIKYFPIRLPGCLADVDPIYRLPVVLSCACSQCLTATTDCTTGVETPLHCTKPQWDIPASRSPILFLSGNSQDQEAPASPFN